MLLLIDLNEPVLISQHTARWSLSVQTTRDDLRRHRHQTASWRAVAPRLPTITRRRLRISVSRRCHGITDEAAIRKTNRRRRATKQEHLQSTHLDDLVLWLEASSLRRRVLVHGSDELARFALVAVQVEAVAVGFFPHVAETRPQDHSLLLQHTPQARSG